MKTFQKIYLIGLMSMIISISISQVQMTSKSTIHEVHLFQNGANVVRKSTGMIKKGLYQFTIQDIPNNLILKSLKVATKSDLRIISVKPNITSQDTSLYTNKLEILSDSFYHVSKDIELIKIKLMILQEEEKLLNDNKPKFTGDFAIKQNELKEIIEYNSEKSLEILTKKMVLNEKLEKYKSVLRSIEQKVQFYRHKIQNNQVHVLITLESFSDQTAEFTVSYFTQHAFWKPQYDVYVQQIDQPVDLKMKALIAQNTDEDWNNIALSVSNGEPTEYENHPTISPWFLKHQSQNYFTNNQNHNPDIRHVSGIVTNENGENLIGASVSIKEYPHLGTITDLAGRFFLPVPVGSKFIIISYTGYETHEQIVSSEHMQFVLKEGNVLNEVVLNQNFSFASVTSGRSIKMKDVVLKDYVDNPSQVQYQPTTFTYLLKDKVSLKTHSEPVTFEVVSHSIPSNFNYISVPKYDKSVFLTAGLLEWRDYNLLSGNAQLYLENNYVGQSFIDVNKAQDTLLLSLGRDKSIIVERTKVKEFAKKSFFKNNIFDTRAYAYIIKNNKNQSIQLNIIDHIPISYSKEIEVTNIEHEDAQINNETGIVTWKITVPPKKDIRKDLKFTVKYPASQYLNLDN